MKLYELTSDFRQLYEASDDFEDDPDAWFDTLEGIEGEIDEKVLNIGKMIQAFRVEVDGMKKAEESMRTRRKARENAIERMKEYIMYNLDVVGKKRVDDLEIGVSVRATPASVRIDDEDAFIAWAQDNRDDLLKYAAPTINKTAVKQELTEGKEIAGAHLEQGRTVIIK